MDAKRLGIFGEKIASEYLKKKGYAIVDQNYVAEWGERQKGEIDIVAQKDKTISFVEVKTRTLQVSEGFLPEESVGFQKQAQLIKLAQIWLVEKNISFESSWQIDIIAIEVDVGTKKAKVRHLENAIC